MVGFTKAERSTFKYWFAHWCSFNMTALNLHIWRPKYLLHDIEKPWLKLFCKYKTVQKMHRYHSSHHMEYHIKHGFNKMDWLAMVVDNECSRFTKLDSPMTAREWYDYIIKSNHYTLEETEQMTEHYLPILNKLNL